MDISDISKIKSMNYYIFISLVMLPFAFRKRIGQSGSSHFEIKIASVKEFGIRIMKVLLATSIVLVSAMSLMAQGQISMIEADRNASQDSIGAVIPPTSLIPTSD